ncbi:MAG TPA: hypothetical protein PLO61_01165 [Fimbriimonadaceae bacterium]|nr:hypothetical protein [Fimbriimonadaceae bacterium]HRJ33759.1 hypothetical protein [Fimbriimonadaceae bacterium]
MIWMQACVCFLVWIGYGVWMRSRNELLRRRFQGMSRRARTLYGSIGLIGGVIVLMAGLALVATTGGLEKDGLTLWAWPLVALLGLGFVHMQVMGAAALITQVQEEETLRRRPTSEHQQPSGSQMGGSALGGPQDPRETS